MNSNSGYALYSKVITYRQITAPSGTRIIRDERLEQGDYSFAATEDGTYRYCFSNVFPNKKDNKTDNQEFEHSKAKEVSFNVHGIVYVPASSDDSDPLEREVRALGELLRQVKDEQEYIKIRERTHRNSKSLINGCTNVAAESTNARVKWWSIFQTGVLVGVCVFQVAYLKRFFG